MFEELVYFIKVSGVAALMATHNFDLAARMDRVLTLNDGLLVEATHAQSRADYAPQPRYG